MRSKLKKKEIKKERKKEIGKAQRIREIEKIETVNKKNGK